MLALIVEVITSFVLIIEAASYDDKLYFEDGGFCVDGSGTLVSSKGTRITTIVVVTLFSMTIKVLGYLSGNYGIKVLTGILSAIVDADLLLVNWTPFLELDQGQNCINDNFVQYNIIMSNWGFLVFPFMWILGMPCLLFFGKNYPKFKALIRVLGVFEMVFDVVF